ncbi:hypothetical protein L6452_08019 [Arctium lappa]|uniref:Uncharacterized protein n=3 Tax=Arctium lappa TaxID=4217 RepID=A0ACB9DH70_ARCLA|nr:hypothetical protein L6452_08017 [Arctium lappa]KAI3745617.1 hypothetical protein L6452_08018 [Arctium lappa]KAI3745618.1 hypothetical protein L6452_08019 [Arctium lappa]
MLPFSFLSTSLLQTDLASLFFFLLFTVAEVVRKRAEIFERYDGDIAWQHTEVDVPRKELERIAKAMVEPKEELRRLILDPAMGQLDKLFNELNLQDDDEADLYTISVNFQVFRHLGYKLSCGMELVISDDDEVDCQDNHFKPFGCEIYACNFLCLKIHGYGSGGVPSIGECMRIFWCHCYFECPSKKKMKPKSLDVSSPLSQSHP